jgi:RimJ/RimL family protein N-acetyltransferase
MSDPAILQPTLEGQRIIVRPIRAEDFAELYSLACDPSVWEQHPAQNRHLEPEFRAFFDGALHSGSGFSFVDKATGLLMGSSRYGNFNPDRREIEIGWTFLGKDYWGKQFNAESKTLMIDHAFTFVDTVLFWVDENNKRSQRALDKFGARRRPNLHKRAEADLKATYRVYEIHKNAFP